MRKKVLLLSLVISMISSVSMLAQTVLFSEDFEDQNAATRLSVGEMGTSNVYDLATDYATTPVSPVVNGGTYCAKIAVNTSASEASAVGLFPAGGAFTPHYTLSFDAWMNHNGQDATTEFIYFGVEHATTTVLPTDGVDFALTADCGSSRDIRVYASGTENTYADCPTCYPGGSTTDAGGNEVGQNTGLAYSVTPGYYANSLTNTTAGTGNQWIHYSAIVTATDVTFSVNGVPWGHFDISSATAANLMVGYTDLFSSVGNAESYVLIDNIKVVDDSGSGIANNQIDGFRMYPNPAQNVLHLQANDAINHVTIYNVFGAEVLKASEVQSQMDISGLKQGAYFVKVQTDNQTGTYKLIKQ